MAEDLPENQNQTLFNQYEELESLIAIYDQDFHFETKADQQLYELRSLTNISFIIDISELKIKVWFSFPTNYLNENLLETNPEESMFPGTNSLNYRIIKMANEISPEIERRFMEEVNRRLCEEYLQGENNTMIVVELIKDVYEQDLERIKNSVQAELKNVNLNLNSNSSPESDLNSKNNKILRYFIYSHHIYSPTKRKNLIMFANEQNLTGFSRNGKPGVVIVEGEEAAVKNYWKRVRSWNWQHIEVKYEEFDDKRLFDKDFNNKTVELDGFDLAELNKLLMEKDRHFVFKIFFGVEGALKKQASDEDDKPKTNNNNNYNNLKIDQKYSTYRRYWIWTHHAFNGAKRDPKRTDTVKLAKSLNLTGFMLPCKPGVIMVEGPEENCDEYWKDIKTWGWLQIEIRAKESLKFEPKFDSFFDLDFCLDKNSSRKNASDMGEFKKYLEEKDLGFMFPKVFKINQ